MMLDIKQACEVQWNIKGVAYPLNLAGWLPTKDKLAIFKTKGRRLQILNSFRARQTARIRKQQELV